jgi:beta-lactam-binding protein with PASTA domain
VKPRPVVRCLVPNVKGKTVAQARKLLAAKRCALGKVTRTYSGKVKLGRIVSQSRRPGARLPRGAKVNVGVSRGKRRR